MNAIVVNEANQWRLATPGAAGWARSPYPGAANKYFMVSADTHLNLPTSLFKERLDATYRDRVVRVITDEKGESWIVSDGQRPHRVVVDSRLEDEDLYRQKSGLITDEAGVQRRLADHALDGIDGEVIFPGSFGLFMFATGDPQFAQAMCRVYNDWAWQLLGAHAAQLKVAACVATGDVPSALAEIERVAKKGYTILNLPIRPVFGSRDVADLNYNLKEFDPLWALIQDLDLAITFHIGTGNDPRGARGPGGAIINYVTHALAPAIEPVTCLCASGVLERFPKLRFAIVEAGIGWIPHVLDAMDEAYRKHHFWVRPKLKQLPSDYFRAHGAATFQEDITGLTMLEEYRLEDNLMWANDYPHHEGTFPHSAQAIERTMGRISETARAKILGLNAARFFGFETPRRFLA